MLRDDKKSVATSCAECGTTFYRNLFVDAAKKFCSRECQQRAAEKRRRARRKSGERVEPKEARCAHCAKRFIAPRPYPPRRFCSHSCRRNWWRAVYEEAKRMVIERGLGDVLNEAKAAVEKRAPALTGAESGGRPKEEESVARRGAAKKRRKPSARSPS